MTGLTARGERSGKVLTSRERSEMEMPDRGDSVFRRYYQEPAFQDRILAAPQEGVDVIIPVIHTNEFWKANLLSLYREIPIHQLLIGDGGCIDDSLSIAATFPRVKILDHRNFKTLGYSIRKLMDQVQTEWFIYVHSDVFLPAGWFDAMKRHQSEYDWFGCPMQHTVMVEYQEDYGERPWAGSQMGRKAAFQAGLDRIDDDYVYRQEDYVFADIVKNAGYKEGRVDDTFHYHQTIYKPSPWFRKVKSVKLDVEMSPEEDVRVWTMQTRGTIKYLQPATPQLIKWVRYGMCHLVDKQQLEMGEFRRWVKQTNPAWLPYIGRWILLRHRLASYLRRAYRMFVKRS